ncbi:uncharacterized protein LOC131232476 isoform X2 [Magnolia sinica]|uniref:uncharacterized protein LOC131232476 isoform X2 n=1 Tax=Magnolia sinica TaxID=86752 RepID=UPI0026586567|nr:uncharacterized protein LOC131232476 isoform X2 [Magnolia sinica]
MADTERETAKALELRLLRCSLSPSKSTAPPPPTIQKQSPNLLPFIEEITSSIEKGDYSAALSSDTVGLVFQFADSWEFKDSADCADRFYHEVEKSAESFLRKNDSEAWLSVLEPEDDPDRSCRAVLVMCIGVAAFLAFTQLNMTGPVEELPPFPLTFLGSKKGKAVSGSGEWEMWARRQLMSSGSDLLGKFSHLQYIVYAKMLLSKVKDLSMEGNNSCLSGTRTVVWWLSRLILLQQRILDERLSSLYDLLRVLMNETVGHFGNLDEVVNYWGTSLCEGEALAIVSMAHLEAGLVEHTYGRVDSSRIHFNCAQEASGLHLSVTGVLGFRTVHQVEAKAQMVLVTNATEQKSGNQNDVMESHALRRCSSPLEADKMVTHSDDQHENCDILMTPRLVETEKDAGSDASAIQNGGSAKATLDANQQAVILAQCLFIKKSNPDDELQGWQMAPFIEAIDGQQLSYFIVQGIYESFPGAAQRICFAYDVYIPTIPALRKEYGELLVSSGMIGEALKIFEDLELWDNLIYCYRLLGKKAAAVELIKARLCDMPHDPRLWCSLGDVTNDDAYYDKALEVSNNRSARAKRSLARSAYNRGDYETSKVLWESAMALNSLYPDGWFALGAAALKARDIDKALEGFTRAVTLDPENGEAWNNIACLHMIKKKSKEAFIAFKEALKFRRTNWQLWENYSQVAMDIGNFNQALEATKTVLDLTNNKRIDAELLERLMVEMEVRSSRHDLSSTTVGGPNCAIQTSPSNSSGDSLDNLPLESSMARSWETEHLMDLLGKVLQQIVRSGGGGDIWGLYARWYKIKGDLTMCSEALLKQVRSYQGSDLWHSEDRFKKFAHASLQLCKVYMEIASSTGSHRELAAAEMHLKNTIKQAVRFSDTDEFRDLQACLDQIKK